MKSTTTDKIAIIDDDPISLSMAQFVVERAGFSTATFASAERFLMWAQHESPGAVLLDLNLPRMDGFALMSRLHEKCADVPVIVISGNLDATNARELFSMGAFDTVLKPFEDGEIVTKLRAAIASRNQLVTA